MRYSRRRRGSDSRWWISQLALLLAAGAVIAVAAIYSTSRDHGRTASANHGVLGVRKTVTDASPDMVRKPVVRKKAVATTAPRKAAGPLLAAHTPAVGSYLGKYVSATAARVTAVVGPSIFWVAGSSGVQYLVHMQRGDAAWSIHTGQRLKLGASIVRSRTQRLRTWGLTPSEGLGRAVRQGYHLGVVGPRIRFACVARCYGRPVRP